MNEREAMSSKMRRETIENKLRRLALDSDTKPTGELDVCAKCGEPINVADGMDFEDGDWCYICWSDWGRNVAPLLRMKYGINTPAR